MDKEDPEQLFEIFEDHFWDNKDDIIKDITSKLREFGYSTVDVTKDVILPTNEYYINFVCEHGVVCGHVWIYEDEDDGYIFDISDYDANNELNECPMCKKVKTIKTEKKEIGTLNEHHGEEEKIKILDKKTVEEIINLIESEEYYITDDEIIISDEEGIVLTLKEILKGKNENYKIK